ncbi:MAG: restriction endonuclease subunit S, partial [Helicobacteraceae bacterium]|nr:restriction endonuclease subunit S [Helicobacteraceae bacterium]
ANAKFVYFYLQSSVFLAFFNTEISGIIGGVNKDKLPNFKIPLPPLKEQEFIAKKLEELFVLTKELKT